MSYFNGTAEHVIVPFTPVGAGNKIRMNCETLPCLSRDIAD